MIDAGGARIRIREQKSLALVPRSEATVTVTVTETHDGKVCDCINQEMTLRVGDELTLDHVCHDGRVDKVVATVVAIGIERDLEHGQATVRVR